MSQTQPAGWRRRYQFVLALLVALALIAIASPGSTWSEDSSRLEAYDLSWWSVDGGGETLSSGGSYTLGSSLGAPDAGAAAGKSFGLGGGFWGGGEVTERYDRYLPLVVRDH
jgi:hypothetical protein